MLTDEVFCNPPDYTAEIDERAKLAAQEVVTCENAVFIAEDRLWGPTDGIRSPYIISDESPLSMGLILDVITAKLKYLAAVEAASYTHIDREGGEQKYGRPLNDTRRRMVAELELCLRNVRSIEDPERKEPAVTEALDKLMGVMYKNVTDRAIQIADMDFNSAGMLLSHEDGNIYMDRDSFHDAQKLKAKIINERADAVMQFYKRAKEPRNTRATNLKVATIA